MQVSAAFLCGFRSDQLRETADGQPVNVRDRGHGDPARPLRLARPTGSLLSGPAPYTPLHHLHPIHDLHPTTFRTWRPFSWERHPRDDAVADI